MVLECDSKSSTYTNVAVCSTVPSCNVRVRLYKHGSFFERTKPISSRKAEKYFSQQDEAVLVP